LNNQQQTLGTDNILIPRLTPEERQERYLKEIKRILSQNRIESDLDLEDTPITTLGNLKHVGGSLNLYNTPITNLGNLEYVGGNLRLSDTPISRLSKKERDRILSKVEVRGIVDFE